LKNKNTQIILFFLIFFSLYFIYASFFSGYKDIKNYNDVEIVIESPKNVYYWGEPIPIKITAKNIGKETFTYSSSEPVYDLIIRKGVWHNPEGFWILSQNTTIDIPTEIILQPGEEQVLIDTVWKPEKQYLFADVTFKFGDGEYETGIKLK